LCAVLTGLTMLAGCSGATRSPRIDPAIALFVSGQYEQAIERLNDLAASLESEAALREVYYYLGRSHLALGHHHRAIDAFSAGVAYGDTGACVEYLEQLRTVIAGEEKSVVRSERVTRRQLAAAIARRFLGGDSSDESLRDVVANGWMAMLPDGSFHGDAHVTRASLYVVCSRMLAQWGLDTGVLGPYREGTAVRGGEPVSGAEVSSLLDELVMLRKRNGG
jgi:hypothetical protein